MNALTLQQILAATAGNLVQQGTVNEIRGISTDTRNLQKGDLFIPLAGENFDGHDFISAALKKEAGGILYSKESIQLPEQTAACFVIYVKDTLAALQSLSGYYRQQFSIPFVAVTGSTGKTSTKDLISSLLAQKYAVLKNEGNLNNEIGLPLTLFHLDAVHQVGVLEMGMSAFGEIQALVDLVKPQIGVITNIGMSHIEHLGSQQNIMKAKMEVAANFEEGNVLLVNGDDPFLATLRNQESVYQTITYGLSKENDFYPIRVQDLGLNGSVVEVEWQQERYTFDLKIPGIHQVYNFLPALWIGFYYGLSFREVQQGIAVHQPSHMRLEIHTHQGVTVINDAYNASPDSMKAALKVLNDMKENRRIAVLGNMLEMGTFAEKGHGIVGESFGETDIEILITVGEQAKWIGTYAHKKGKSMDQIIHTENNEEAIGQLKRLIKERDAVLIKGSRGMKMEEIVEYLLERS